MVETLGVRQSGLSLYHRIWPSEDLLAALLSISPPSCSQDSLLGTQRDSEWDHCSPVLYSCTRFSLLKDLVDISSRPPCSVAQELHPRVDLPLFWFLRYNEVRSPACYCTLTPSLFAFHHPWDDPGIVLSLLPVEYLSFYCPEISFTLDN